MQDNGKSKKSNRQSKNTMEVKSEAAYETFALAGGKRNPRGGTTIPPEEGVEKAKQFVEENKK